MSDVELLREYVERRSESAFESLVQRHVHMVYAAALRQVRDPHLAQDVTQAVFILLSRKARSLGSRVVLAGWLHRTAGYVASRVIRDRMRQQRREEEAARMHIDDSAGEEWEQAAPHLDAAIASLGTADRNAVVLRFLERRSFRDVADGLGISEVAARKRIERALEKLRGALRKRGVAAGSALATVLMQQTTTAAPPAAVHAAISAGTIGQPNSIAVTLADAIARQWMLARVKLIGAGAGALVVLLAMIQLSDSTGLNPDERAVAQEGAARMVQPTASPDSDTALPVESRTASPIVVMHVRSAADGRPLSNAIARIRFGISSPVIAHANADTNGVITSVPPDGRFEGMAWWLWAPGHVPRCVFWDPPEGAFLPSQYTVELDPAVSASGIVVTPEGTALPGARVRFVAEGGIQWNTREYADYRFTVEMPVTDESGRWHADFLADEPTAAGYVSHPDYAETAFSFALAAFGATNVIIPIERGISVGGTVKDPDGIPIAGARVTLDREYSEREAIHTVTDPSGGFLISNATPGPARLRVTSNAHRTHESAPEVSEPGLRLSVVLETKPAVRKAGSSTLHGRVVDESGESLSRVRVSLAPGQPGLAGVEWSGTTDSHGRFAWTEAPDGVVRLRFRPPNGGPAQERELDSGEQEHLITLVRRSEPHVHLRVTDLETGRAVDRFRVMHGVQDTTFAHGQFSLSFAGEGARGEFASPLREEARDATGDPRSMPVVRVEADGYEPQTIPLLHDGEIQLQHHVTLEPARMFQGTVYSPSGTPAGRAQLALTGGDLTATIGIPGRFRLARTTREHIRVARLNGAYRMDLRKDAAALAVVHEEGWAILPLVEFAGGDIHLQPWARVEGTLQRGQHTGGEQTIGIRARAGAPGFLLSTQTSADGSFRFDKVLPGELEVYRIIQGATISGATAAGVQSSRKLFNALPGQTAQVRLGGEGVRVIGRLKLEKEHPDAMFAFTPQSLRRSGTPLETQPDSYGFFCDQTGAFTIEDVEPGEYVLTARIESVMKSTAPNIVGIIRFPIAEGEFPIRISEDSGTVELGTLIVPERRLEKQ